MRRHRRSWSARERRSGRIERARFISLVVSCSANAPLSRLDVFSGCRVSPSPCFPPLSIGEGWSAGRRPGSLAIGSLRPALRSAGLTRRASGTQVLEGGGGPVARGPLARKPGRLSALHRGTHCRRPHLAPSSGVAIDDAVRRSKAWRWYRGERRKEGLFELECEFSGESGNARNSPTASIRYRGARHKSG